MGPDMLRDIQGNGRGHTVVGTLFVESGWQTPGAEPAMAKVKEADMATDLHKQFPKLCQGIVAAVDLGLGAEVEPALAYYQKNPMVKAIRHGVAFSADPAIFTPPQVTEDLAYDTKFREGLALLKQYGFVYETWNYHEQLEDIADLAKTFPEQTIVCDHLGMPLGLGHWKREEVFPNWQVLMEELAKCPNVFVKIGGLGQRFFGFGFDERLSPPSSDELAMAWQPYVEHCIKVFGVDRCIMESNFPIDKISCSYTVCFNALKKCVRSLSKEEKHKLFELNARRAYGL
ncbi:unnamed protein product [Effrenium voratum]|uniref:Amidohydrolase-related domain-containing protein n=1 Tax=Effrenium voratum TaxID=2562239 RepID=A0AA36MGZ1_9DINO|nr:unnamed protein product [Effrenium voratum]